jgi:hypothetical protein
MTRKPILAALALLGVAGIAAPVAHAKPRLRVIHNFSTAGIPQPATVDVRVGTEPDAAANPVVVTVAYGDVTDYLKLERGTYTVGVFAAGSTTVKLLDTQLRLRKRDRATVLARQASTTDSAFTVEVLPDRKRRSRRRTINVRVIHGIPAPAADNVRIGAVGAGCLTPPVSFPTQAIIEVPRGTYTLGVFPPSDPDCTGAPIVGLSVGATLEPRREYTAIARVAVANPNAFELQAIQDF